MGLLSIIAVLMAGVGFLTFGFTEAVCGKPPNRFHSGQIENASVIIHGYDYDFSHFKHPATQNVFNGQTNPLLQGNWNVAGADISFMFQITNENCKPFRILPSRVTWIGISRVCNVYSLFKRTWDDVRGRRATRDAYERVSVRVRV